MVSGDNFIQYKTVRTLWRLELKTTEIWITYFRLLSVGNWVVLVMSLRNIGTTLYSNAVQPETMTSINRWISIFR
ncbi:hypothetical protein EYC80_008933 [Monilinia laxa]|uniref:Uncharacterized protein n=1 Tax=Monilinia laxa TaxID=61186 RepID=A0A5N6K286_MONLA|nr:hypothetical protein EYC80_008933 [Monilinia laxa]